MKISQSDYKIYKKVNKEKKKKKINLKIISLFSLIFIFTFLIFISIKNENNITGRTISSISNRLECSFEDNVFRRDLSCNVINRSTLILYNINTASTNILINQIKVGKCIHNSTLKLTKNKERKIDVYGCLYTLYTPFTINYQNEESSLTHTLSGNII